MRLPSDEVLRSKLKQWREQHNKTAEDIAANYNNSKNKSLKVKILTKEKISRWENSRVGINYDTLVEVVLPAYEIEDFDTFLDYCRTPTLDEIVFIPAAEYGNNPIRRGTIGRSLSLSFLKDHRTRIDQVTFRANSQEPTDWAPHSGHEFVLALKGSVKCEFATSVNGDRKSFTLNQGDAILFSSSLYHRFQNADPKTEAELVAAKPSHSGIAAAKR